MLVHVCLTCRGDDLMLFRLILASFLSIFTARSCPLRPPTQPTQRHRQQRPNETTTTRVQKTKKHEVRRGEGAHAWTRRTCTPANNTLPCVRSRVQTNADTRHATATRDSKKKRMAGGGRMGYQAESKNDAHQRSAMYNETNSRLVSPR